MISISTNSEYIFFIEKNYNFALLNTYLLNTISINCKFVINILLFKMYKVYLKDICCKNKINKIIIIKSLFLTFIRVNWLFLSPCLRIFILIIFESCRHYISNSNVCKRQGKRAKGDPALTYDLDIMSSKILE